MSERGGSIATGTTWSWWVGGPEGAGTEHRSMVLLPTSDVDWLVEQHRALECATWGELRALDPRVYQEILEATGYAEDSEEHFIAGDAGEPWEGQIAVHAELIARHAAGIPDDSTPFSAEDELPVADGDWPESALSLMNQRLPGDLVDRFGSRWSTTLNGEFAALRPSNVDEVLAEVRAAGAHVRKDSQIAILLERDGWAVCW